MELVKKNITSIICGVIALLAIVALFWPISGYYSELQTKVDSRKQVYSSLRDILNKQRNLPVVDLKNAEPKPLDRFPTQAVIDAGDAVMKQVKTQSSAMFEAVLKLNQHKPLVPGALPEGTPMYAGRFRRAYEAEMLVDLFRLLNPANAGNTAPDQKAIENAEKSSTIFTVMNAGFPPTAQQIAAARFQKEQEIRAKTAYTGQGQPINGPQIEAELAQKLPQVGLDLTKKTADSCKVYIDPTSLDPLQMIMQLQPNQTPDPSVMYAAQISLWIQQDVAASIASANANAKTVEDSAVKHLVEVRMPQDFMQQAISSGGTMMMPTNPDGSTPPPPNPDPAVKPPQSFLTTPTGRISNGVYDVYPFTLKLDVDAAQVPRVLEELSRNKLVTVTNCSLSAVDLGLMQANGYYYGKKPVVTLDLTCEALFLRKWTEPFMPLRIKQYYGITPQQPQQPSE